MNTESLAALGNAVASNLNLGYEFWGFCAPKELYDALDDCCECGHYYERAVYNRLYALNVKAYRGRYDEPFTPEDMTGPDVNMANYVIHRKIEYKEVCSGTYSFVLCSWHYQLAKLLDCYLYQTAENAAYNSPLRSALGQFRKELYEFIVMHHPQYIAPRWGRIDTAALC